MLDTATPDAVFLCVAPFAHGQPEREWIDRRIPFLVEKPLAIDWETAADVGQLVAASGLTTAVGYHWRYMDTVEEARERLSDNPARLVIGH
jgi:predicted dehydrogenase